MKRLPLGIQSLRKIIEGGYVYVDKTKYICDLLDNASCYFLSRPRRFGKSLLLDTINEVFNGDKELFKGLWIYDSGYSFDKHPVLRLDMSNIANKTPETLEHELSNELMDRANAEGFCINESAPPTVFKRLIDRLFNKYKQSVVILIDEYDKPILDHLDDLEIAEANRKVLRSFYGILKSMDPFLRLTFVTGVSKFTKTSLFSEMNNLLDISMSKKYASICGVATEDLSKYFGEYIEKLSTLDDFKHSGNLSDEILAWYDGYSWDGRNRVINPFSLLSFFIQEKFYSYWYASGSPKFLMDMIKENPELYLDLKDLRMSEWALDSFDISNIAVQPLLFQTGYLTVREVFPDAPPYYLLDIPNHEVRYAFNLNMIAEFTGRDGALAERAYRQIYRSLKSGDLKQILIILKSLFASIPYQLHIDREAYYHSIFYAVMNVIGFDMDSEVSTSKGRIDAVLELSDTVYIMEFKYRDCAPDASPETKKKLFDEALKDGLEQITAKGYRDKYGGSGKKIIAAAFAFLGKDNIEMAVSEEV